MTSVFTSGLSAPEGPVALPDNTWLIVEGGSGRGCVTHIGVDGHAKRIIKKMGRPNGLAIDSRGAIWVAESKPPSLIRLTMDGKAEVVARGWNQEAFLFPNDLCFGPDGDLYLTDSGVIIDEFAPENKVRSDYMGINYEGRVYRINVTTGKVTKLDEGLKFTNGIAFGPDNRLYVNETLTGNIYRYDSQENALASGRELFANVISPSAPPGWKGPDGMAFSVEGDLYVAVFGQRDVTVINSSGEVVRRIKTLGRLPTNVAFARSRQQLFITEYEFGRMEHIAVSSNGFPLGTDIPLQPEAHRKL